VSVDIRIIHFYPDLMSLYGSYANLLVLRRALEQMGNHVSVETVRPGQETDLSGADFIFMGAGTERSARAAMKDLARFGDPLRALADEDVSMLFCGTAMELLGSSVTDRGGDTFPGLCLAGYTVRQTDRRYVGDVVGHCEAVEEPVVGFVNKCSLIDGVDTPLLVSLEMGIGNTGPLSPEGFRFHNVWGSELTGPLLVKNPRLLDAVLSAVYARRGDPLPGSLPRDEDLEAGYTVTSEALRERIGKA